MTNEEAIDLLSEITMYCDFTDEYGDYINDEPYITAVDMAIKALEQQPCEDAISREQVLYEAIYYADRPTDTFIKDVLKQLPSVQPFSRTFEITYRYERKPVEDCVSRESVIEWLKNRDIIKTKNQEDNARRELDDLPSVTPQQPCDDCRFANDNSICEVCCHKYSSMFTDMRGDSK